MMPTPLAEFLGDPLGRAHGRAGIDENVNVDWITLASTAIGAALALGATVIAHFLTSRDGRKRETLADQRRAYLDFALAAEAAHDGLRRAADPGRPHEDLTVETRHAMSESGVYGARETLLVTASAEINGAGEVLLRRLAVMRKAIRSGATLGTRAYHDVYHPVADALWRLRAIARSEFGNEPFKPEDLNKTTWDSQEDCAECRRATAVVAAQGPPVPPPRPAES
jgi:hypothetical protein